MNQEEEKALVYRSRQGDEAAFAELVAFLRPKVFHHCLDIVKDQESAEDITQEALLHAYQHLTEFRMHSRFSTWLYRIAHNLSLNHLRNTKRRQEHQLKEEMLSSSTQENKKEVDESILALIEALPEKHRIVFQMYEIERLSQKEIAVRLNVPYGTVRSRLHYAREKIRPKDQKKVSKKSRSVSGKSPPPQPHP